jgi:hypothetical protein
MSITASVNSSPITARVSGSSVSASVGASRVSATISAGIGPAGPQGPAGDAASLSISNATDVTFDGVTDGDVLRYQTGRWRNYPQDELLDAGNF